jgi:glutathione S-transferase
MRAVARATLYSIPGSHPAMAARRMLELKGIDYRRVDLMPWISHGVLRAMRFPGHTVPSMRIDGRKITGSREIARELDRLVPEPPLFPADPDQRVKVEDAERWGDEVLQAPVRRILWNAMRRDRQAMASFAVGARLGVPVGLAVRTGGPIVAAASRMNKADDESVRADLAALPEMLDRIDGWIEEGVLAGDEVNAADLQISTSLRLAMTLDDLRPHIDRHKAAALAMSAIPDFPGNVPPILPPEWLQPLQAAKAPA